METESDAVEVQPLTDKAGSLYLVPRGLPGRIFASPRI